MVQLKRRGAQFMKDKNTHIHSITVDNDFDELNWITQRGEYYIESLRSR